MKRLVGIVTAFVLAMGAGAASSRAESCYDDGMCGVLPVYSRVQLSDSCFFDPGDPMCGVLPYKTALQDECFFSPWDPLCQLVD
jgi:hypothetical protein